MYKSSIWGPTCDGLDVVVKECLLPELKTEEFMVFKNMGAYTLSGAVAFNGIPLARCIYVASTSWDTIKDAFVDEMSITDDIMASAPATAAVGNNNSLSATMISAATVTSCAAAAYHTRSISLNLDDLHIVAAGNHSADDDSGDEAKGTIYTLFYYLNRSKWAQIH